MDPPLWESTRHNPVLMLQTINQQALEALAADEGFLTHLDSVKRRLDEYLKGERSWFNRNRKRFPEKFTVAYFSAEFGLTECIPIYSGGLGILAGDHVKTASDLGIPLVGVGLMYQHGYFRQYLNIDGYQQEAYYDNDPFRLPVTLVRQEGREPLLIAVEFPGRNVHARIWLAQVGRVSLFLLDTNVPQNSPNDRAITYQLYGGDKEMRIQQEILIGIGGLRALAALGIEPSLIHMNEGHAAFSGIERIRRVMESAGLDFEQARMAVRAGGVFTTHTPVPAGIDMFEPGLVDRYFSHIYERLGLNRKSFLAMGRRNPDNDLEPFNMVFLAFRTTDYLNGVSRLHGKVSRNMWQSGWPGVPVDEIPITHVTNGIHIHTWISREFAELYDRYLGPRWSEDPSDKAVWERVASVPPEELWRTHERRKVRLVSFARLRLRKQLEERGASAHEVEITNEVLNPQALTIGFARRFATYKRANLILRDQERLKKILTNKDRPVQLIFAGKAHPRDEEGKALIRQIIHFSRDPEIRRQIVFLENYDMVVARYMIQGVDIWMNTPRRPMEASGTSGMKVVVNGGLNMSILDGWWDEGYEIESNSGWAIGRAEEYEDLNLQDQIEAGAVYDLLENEVVPLFYTRTEDGLPRPWIGKMKDSISKLAPMFNTHRMLQEYAERFYLPSTLKGMSLSENNYAKAKGLAEWRQNLLRLWPEVEVINVAADTGHDYMVGTKMEVTAEVKLGGASPGDVTVQIYYGPLNNRREVIGAKTAEMKVRKDLGSGRYLYEGAVQCRTSGQHGFTVRIIPQHPDLVHPYEPGLMQWE